MSTLRTLARSVKSLPLIGQQQWLWQLLRQPYYWLADPFGKGVGVNAAQVLPLRVPKAFAGIDWEHYEAAAVRPFVAWLQAHPRAQVIDVGCATGFYAAIALAASPTCQVLAIDGNLPSLQATRTMCRHIGADRLAVLYGLVGSRPEAPGQWPQAVEQTDQLLAQQNFTIEQALRYQHLGRGATAPVYSLDSLLAHDEALSSRPCLIKADIEGAEMLMMQGAEELVKRLRPVLAISVHPDMLGAWGHSAAQLREMLQNWGYHIELLGTDHEEHWWCSPLV